MSGFLPLIIASFSALVVCAGQAWVFVYLIGHMTQQQEIDQGWTQDNLDENVTSPS